MVIETARNWSRTTRRRRRELTRAMDRIDVLKPYIPSDAVAVELGVFEGLFSELLVEHFRPRRLHLVDPWFQFCNVWDWAAGEPSTVDALCHILKRWKNEIEVGTIRVHIDDDTEVIPRFDDEYFDWVYLDSSHLYEHTKRELELLVPKMKPDGVIAGDDWMPDPSHPNHGVYRAVCEFVDQSDFHLLLSDEETAQWVLQR